MRPRIIQQFVGEYLEQMNDLHFRILFRFKADKSAVDRKLAQVDLHLWGAQAFKWVEDIEFNYMNVHSMPVFEGLDDVLISQFGSMQRVYFTSGLRNTF